MTCVPSPKPRFCLTTLPDEIISMCYANLPANDLVALEYVSHRLHQLIAYDAVCWRRCVQARWGSLSSNSAILPSAARHAGTWKQLYSQKARTDKANSPWLTLCDSETAAILDVIKGTNSGMNESSYWNRAIEAEPGSPPKDRTVSMGASSSPVSVMTGVCRRVLSVVLLVDASSSVTDDDFESMKKFSRALVDELRVSQPEAMVGLVQFNQHPKVEVGLTNVCKAKLATAIDGMEQLMGSTDIAAPIRKARQILKEDEVSEGERVIVLLTDGQTHADELQESEREAKKAYEEVGARLFTLGVGRDIDESGLGRVAAASEGGMHFTLRRLVPSK